MIDERLKEWATEAQVKYIDAVNAAKGNKRAAARELGIHRRVIDRGIERVERKAATQGYAPRHDMIRTAPEPFVVKGTSTYYGQDGQPRGQWVKTALDNEKHQLALREAFAAMAEELPRLTAAPSPAHTLENLCNLYTYTDFHLGMLAWHREGGADWDLCIAEDLLMNCFSRMLMSAPGARIAVINQLGDFLHSDGILPVTPTSGHILDQDGRFSKIVGAAIRVLRRMVDMALAKHDHVVVVMAEGNHDITSSIWLRAMFKALYENEPRVEVIDSELPYYVYRHGRVMLGFHHGHLRKNDQLPLLFAAQFPTIWGATTKRYAHTGHRHHEETKEHSGMKVTQHPTLAARDAHASRHGYLSERQATCITYHAEFGQVGSITVVPEMFETAVAA